MKKQILTIAIILGLGMTAFAQKDSHNGGGMFQKGPEGNEYSSNREGEGGLINLPQSHGGNNDSTAPVGSGIAVLVSLGAAYMVGKKRKE